MVSVPVATLYPLADQITGVGDLEIGGLGEDPGDLGSQIEVPASFHVQ